MRFFWLLVALVTASAGVAAADSDGGEAASATAVHRRVVLVGMPDSVFSATAAALGPWSIAVDATAGPTPVDDAAAAAIAMRHDATAVAWLDGDQLVIYDDLRHAAEREPAQPAVDDVTAAAVALSIKTALRRPVPIELEPDPEPEPEPDPDPEPPVPPAPTEPRRLRVAAHLGMGLPLLIGAQPLLHLSARVSVDLRRAGLAAIAEVGGELMSSVDSDSFTGDYRDLIIGAGVEWRRKLRPGLALTPSALLNLHASHLAGTTSGDLMVDHDAFTGGLQLGLALDQQLGVVRLGGLITAELLLDKTRYQVQGVDALVVPRSSLGWAIRLTF